MSAMTELFVVVGRAEYDAETDEVEVLSRPCRECEAEEAEEWGMCGSCIHDALRSGWIPGEEGSS